MIKVIGEIGSLGQIRSRTCHQDCIGVWNEECSCYAGSTFYNDGTVDVRCKRKKENDPAPSDRFHTDLTLTEIGWRWTASE